MRTPASIARHPIHPMLVPFPIGLWLFSFICDVTFVFGKGVSLWFTLGFYAMVAGVLGGIVAALPGLIDMIALRGAPKKIALVHMALNVTIIALYAINIAVRISSGSIRGIPFVLAVLGIILLAVSGWLGGQMVYVHGVGVSAGSQDERRAL